MRCLRKNKGPGVLIEEIRHECKSAQLHSVTKLILLRYVDVWVLRTMVLTVTKEVRVDRNKPVQCGIIDVHDCPQRVPVCRSTAHCQGQ